MIMNLNSIFDKFNENWQNIYSSGRKDMWLSVVSKSNETLPLETKLNLLKVHMDYYPKIRDFLK